MKLLQAGIFRSALTRSPWIYPWGVVTDSRDACFYHSTHALDGWLFSIGTQDGKVFVCILAIRFQVSQAFQGYIRGCNLTLDEEATAVKQFE